MKKFLSLLCAVALLATCIISLPASADTPVVYDSETFTSSYSEKTVTLEGVYNGTTYTYTATHQLPSDKWNVEKINNDTIVNDEEQLDHYIRKESKISYAPVSSISSFAIPGSAMVMTKMVDIEPGYTYKLIIDTEAFADNASQAHVWLYHKSADGNYTPINDYLSEMNYSITSYSNAEQGNERLNGDSSTRHTSLYSNNLEFDLTINYPEINAIKIGMGGYVDTFSAWNKEARFFGYTLTQTGTVSLEQNSRTYNSETFTSSYAEKEVTLEGVYNGTTYTYTATHQLPSKDWTVEKINNNTIVNDEEQLDHYIRKESKISYAPVNSISSFTIPGSAMVMTKMVDIEPGYTYKLIIDTEAFADNASQAHVWLYHKSADGSYTPINDYLSEMNYSITSYPNAEQGNERLNGDSSTRHTSLYSNNLEFDLTINYPEINAIKIGMGGYVDTFSAWNKEARFFGYTLTQTGTVSLNTSNTRSVTVSYALGNNGGEQTATVNLTGAGEASLRPVASTVDSTVKVVSNTGYFKGWQIGAKTYTSENGKKAPIGEEDKTLTMNALWYTIENNIVSSAQAQRVTLSNNSNAIRFLALVDATYANYEKAGFVVTTLAQNPTVEAGYKPYTFNNIFAKIRSGNSVLDITDSILLSKFTKGASMNPTGILYANLVIPEGSEKITYYATPYVESADGTRVYGSTKAISYTQLETLDVQ